MHNAFENLNGKHAFVLWHYNTGTYITVKNNKILLSSINAMTFLKGRVWRPYIHSFIQYSVWRPVQSLLQNNSSI